MKHRIASEWELSTCLFNHHIDLISVFHLERSRCIVVFDALSVENEATLVVAEALALTISIHQFLKLCGFLYLKEDFGAILRLHFDVELLAACSFWGSGSRVGCRFLLVTVHPERFVLCEYLIDKRGSKVVFVEYI